MSINSNDKQTANYFAAREKSLEEYIKKQEADRIARAKAKAKAFRAKNTVSAGNKDALNTKRNKQKAASNITKTKTTTNKTKTITNKAKVTTKKKQVTIWDPRTKGSKKVVNVGTSLPKGFKIWKHGTRSEEGARKENANNVNMRSDTGKTAKSFNKNRRKFAASELRGGFKTAAKELKKKKFSKSSDSRKWGTVKKLG